MQNFVKVFWDSKGKKRSKLLRTFDIEKVLWMELCNNKHMWGQNLSANELFYLWRTLFNM